MFDIKNCVDFSGKTVIVTGGSMGIGEGCSRVFASAGANVVIVARGEEAGIKLCDELNAAYPQSRCIYVKCDVSKESQIIDVVKTAIETFGCIDCLINNAGVHPEDEFIDDVTADMFNDLIQTNLTSMFMFSTYTLP